MSLFRFVQFEFPWVLGPEDGRYVMRGHAGEAEHVLVIATLGAPQRRWLRGKGPRNAPAEPPPAAVTTSRVTLIGAAPIETLAEAKRWLKDADLDAEADAAVVVLNRILHAHRTAAADAFTREVACDQALVVRVGVGDGDEVARGRWADALELSGTGGARVAKRALALRPQERFAALLSGRDVALACEELTLRARLDLDAGRLREAALQLRVALEAALAELEPWVERTGMADRLDGLREERGPVGAAANSALQGGLGEAAALDVVRALGKIEAALRSRTAAGFD